MSVGLKKQVFGVEIFQINRHNVMAYQNSPNMEGEAAMVERGGGVKPQADLFPLAHVPYGQLKTK